MYVLLTNTEVLQICGITGIEAFLLKGQLRWAGHAMRMSDDRVPKQVGSVDSSRPVPVHSVGLSGIIKIPSRKT